MGNVASVNGLMGNVASVNRFMGNVASVNGVTGNVEGPKQIRHLHVTETSGFVLWREQRPERVLHVGKVTLGAEVVTWRRDHTATRGD